MFYMREKNLLNVFFCGVFSFALSSCLQSVGTDDGVTQNDTNSQSSSGGEVSVEDSDLICKYEFNFDSRSLEKIDYSGLAFPVEISQTADELFLPKFNDDKEKISGFTNGSNLFHSQDSRYGSFFSSSVTANFDFNFTSIESKLSSPINLDRVDTGLIVYTGARKFSENNLVTLEGKLKKDSYPVKLSQESSRALYDISTLDSSDNVLNRRIFTVYNHNLPRISQLYLEKGATQSVIKGRCSISNQDFSLYGPALLKHPNAEKALTAACDGVGSFVSSAINNTDLNTPPGKIRYEDLYTVIAGDTGVLGVPQVHTLYVGLDFSKAMPDAVQYLSHSQESLSLVGQCGGSSKLRISVKRGHAEIERETEVPCTGGVFQVDGITTPEDFFIVSLPPCTLGSKASDIMDQIQDQAGTCKFIAKSVYEDPEGAASSALKQTEFYSTEVMADANIESADFDIDEYSSYMIGGCKIGARDVSFTPVCNAPCSGRSCVSEKIQRPLEKITCHDPDKEDSAFEVLAE